MFNLGFAGLGVLEKDADSDTMRNLGFGKGNYDNPWDEFDNHDTLNARYVLFSLKDLVEKEKAI